MPIARVTAIWRGFRGAPGYSNFYFAGDDAIEQPGAAMALAVRTFFADIATTLPGSVNVSIQPTVDTLDEASGALVGQQDIEVPASVTGGGTNNYSAASGAVVNWLTTSYRNGRRVRGRTFLVPLSSTVYDTNGDLAAGFLTDIREAAQALVDSPGTTGMRVWSRPVNGAGGAAFPVSGVAVPDLGAVLRSRRD